LKSSNGDQNGKRTRINFPWEKSTRGKGGKVTHRKKKNNPVEFGIKNKGDSDRGPGRREPLKKKKQVAWRLRDLVGKRKKKPGRNTAVGLTK